MADAVPPAPRATHLARPRHRTTPSLSTPNAALLCCVLCACCVSVCCCCCVCVVCILVEWTQFTPNGRPSVLCVLCARCVRVVFRLCACWRVCAWLACALEERRVKLDGNRVFDKIAWMSFIQCAKFCIQIYFHNLLAFKQQHVLIDNMISSN